MSQDTIGEKTNPDDPDDPVTLEWLLNQKDDLWMKVIESQDRIIKESFERLEARMGTALGDIRQANARVASQMRAVVNRMGGLEIRLQRAEAHAQELLQQIIELEKHEAGVN